MNRRESQGSRRPIATNPKKASKGLTAGHVDPDKLCHAPCLQWKPVQALCAWISFKRALPEEPGAVIPHAGICEGGVG